MGVAEKLVNRVQMMVGKALLEAVKDNDEMQLIKIAGLDDEIQEDIERIQPYGLSANPPPGASVLVGYVGGNRDHGVAICVDDKSRKKDLKTGEVALYSKFLQFLHFKDDGKTELESQPGFDLLSSMINLGAATGTIPLVMATEAFTTAWSAYFSATSAAWTGLADSGLFATPVVTALKTAATGATVLGEALQETMVTKAL